jgi:hypothetical protein
MPGFSETASGLAVREVIGYRYWNAEVSPAGGAGRRLAGQWAAWVPGVNEAVCLKPFVSGGSCFPAMFWDAEWKSRHRPPVEKPKPCGCGLWGSWDPGCLSPLAPVTRGPQVFGAIRGWGRAAIGELGFRCERAEILALTILDDRRCGCLLCTGNGWRFYRESHETADDMARQLMRDYDVPVLRSREHLVSAYPHDELYGPAGMPLPAASAPRPRRRLW